MSDVPTSPEEATWFAREFEKIQLNVESFIQGKTGVVRLSLVCLAAEGHLLIDDIPGVGKTSLAKAITQSIRGTVNRIQFTPDLLPTDVTGVQIYNSGTGGFEFHQGPVFANVVIGDEINHASPKTQSALLEVMEERQITIDGVTYRTPRPFIVVATQNPVELDGTYHLPEAQIDRFMMKIGVGYPDAASEAQILKNRTNGVAVSDLPPVSTVEDMARMTDIASRIRIASSVLDYIVEVIGATRTLPGVRLGVSPRGGLALAQSSQAFAAANGRTAVTVDDVKALAPYVLGHRVLLSADAEIQGLEPRSMIEGVLSVTAAPLEAAVV